MSSPYLFVEKMYTFFIMGKFTIFTFGESFREGIGKWEINK
jgi:hypothetical protein